MDLEKLIKTIIECAYEVRLALGVGFLESVYQKAMVLELKKHQIDAVAEYPINVYYDDTVVGEFRADLLVEECVILELKAVLVNYLSATHIDNGLLINFGAPKLEIKRKFRQYKK